MINIIANKIKYNLTLRVCKRSLIVLSGSESAATPTGVFRSSDMELTKSDLNLTMQSWTTGGME